MAVRRDILMKYVGEEEVEALLSDLVAIESHSDAEGQEADLAEYLCRLFRREKIDARLVHVLDGRSNLIARIKGPGKGPVLLLNGHLDTVPPYAMKDPFRVRVSHGRIYGRGASDMKGAIAAMIGVLLAVRRSGRPLCGTLMFAGTVGEESYSPGADHLVRSRTKADYVIIGESTELQPCIAHKGIVRAEAIFEGLAVHASVPERGVNAIYKASRWIRHIESKYIPRLARRKHPLLGSPTINIGIINGGTRAAIVPDRCSAVIDYRMLPGQKPADVLAGLRRTIMEAAGNDRSPGDTIRALPLFCGVPHGPMESSARSALVRALVDAYRLEFGPKIEPSGVPYWTDGALFAGIRGASVVVCGPGHIEQAHSNAEYIERRQLHAASRMYGRVVAELCMKKEQ